MIVVDTSALVSIFQAEPVAATILDVLNRSHTFAISAGTLSETLIVASNRGYADAVRELISRLEVEVVPVTAETAQLCADAHVLWGKGKHAAKLNFGDCFAYALAKSCDCPLLFVGNDFAQTDIVSAI